jgi:hypothetical protein
MLNRTVERLEEKEANYFNIIQPHKHHTAVPKQGIYCYSFALFPENYRPSGSLNASGFTTQIYIYTNNADNTEINEKLKKLNVAPYNYKYIPKYYIRSMNMLVYKNGTVGYMYVD